MLLLFKQMVSADAPVLFSKACELFIQELTVRSWLHAEEKKRRTIRKSDIGYAIRENEVFDFLVNAVPMKEIKVHTIIILTLIYTS